MNLKKTLHALIAAATLLAAPLSHSVFDPVNDDTDIFLANPSFPSTRPNVLIFVDNTANWSASAGTSSTPKPVSSLTQIAGTATAVSAAHGFSTGTQVIVAGGSPTGYNLTVTITRIDADTFTYPVDPALTTPATGTITAAVTPFDKKFDAVRAGLMAFVNDSVVLTEEFNVGFSLFAETGQTNGVYMRYAVRQMNPTNRPALYSTLNGLTRTGDNTNNGAFSMAMAEMYSYFAGITARTGSVQTKRDYNGNAVSPGGLLTSGHAFSSSSSTTYVSPILDGCQKNFIIFISNGPSTQNADNDSTETYLRGLKSGVAPTQITLSPSGSEGDWSDEYADFMSNADCNTTIDGVQNVYTYTIDILPSTQNQEVQHTALLKSIASKGKGKYFVVNDASTTNQFTGILATIFKEVQAVNSVFASTTLPVSVNVRGTNLNQVYIGVFRPDANKSPRWLGNLKLYRLGVNTATQALFLADSTGAAAENASTGFITGSAKSFWTTGTSYWGFRDATLNGSGGVSDLPDGDLVEKGGAAQRLRVAYPTTQAARSLYTCVNGALNGPCAGGASLSATPFNSTYVTASDLGAFTTYTVGGVSSSGDTVTFTLAGAPLPVPAWASTNPIKLEGAAPENYNVTNCALTGANNVTFTYTYSLAACGKTQPDASTVRVTATGHGLLGGELLTVSGSALGTFDVTDASVARLDANTFQYPKAGASGTIGSTGITTSIKKAISIGNVTGTAGASLATVNLTGHGFASSSTVKITGADAATQDFFNRAGGVSISSVTANSFQYATSSAISGGNSATLAASAHNMVSGQSNVHIAGNANAYNTTSAAPLSAVVVTSTSQLSFTSSNAASSTSGVIGYRVTNFFHTTTGNDKDDLTVTTSGNHNITGPFPYSITLAGGTNEGSGKDYTTYNGTWSITSGNVPSSNTFKISNSTFDGGGIGAPATHIVAGKAITSITPGVVSSTLAMSAQGALPSTPTAYTALTTATGSMTAGRIADGDDTLRDNIIAWVRGADNRNDENSVTTPAGSDIRPSVHGDVLHSRPAVVNYNRYGDDNDIYAYYGGNDGIFRALKGGIALHTTGADVLISPGTERWGFIPREFLGKLKRLREQSPLVSNLNQKDYFADGSIGIYQKDAKGSGDAASPITCNPADVLCTGDTVSGVIGDNTNAIYGDKVHIYMTMRRGGALMYALNVTDPSAPKLLWRKSSSDAGWEQLGQTWSEPKVSRSNASLGNSNNPDNVVLIFGAGYDETVEDVNPCLLSKSTLTAIETKAVGSGTVTYTSAGSCTIVGATGSASSTSRSKGRGILVVDAFNGAVVWQASSAVTTSATGLAAGGARKLNVPDMSCAIPSDVTVLDKNRDGFADRIYVGDTCGQVWRADLTNTDMDEWTATKIASISAASDTDIANKRKFLFPADLVFGTDANLNYTAVLLGSGDREHPFDTNVINSFYMLKDRDSSDPGDPQSGATNSTSTKIAGFGTAPTGSPFTDANVFDASSVIVDGSALSLNGWKITLAGGEKVISSATSVAGTVFFNTNQPSATTGGSNCDSNLGKAREYLVGFADASATVDLNKTGGLTIADRWTEHAGGGYLPSPVPVVVEIDGKKYQAVISGTSVQTPPGLTLEKRIRQYWYKEVD